MIQTEQSNQSPKHDRKASRVIRSWLSCALLEWFDYVLLLVHCLSQNAHDSYINNKWRAGSLLRISRRWQCSPNTTVPTPYAVQEFGVALGQFIFNRIMWIVCGCGSVSGCRRGQWSSPTLIQLNVDIAATVAWVWECRWWTDDANKFNNIFASNCDSGIAANCDRWWVSNCDADWRS